MKNLVCLASIAGLLVASPMLAIDAANQQADRVGLQTDRVNQWETPPAVDPSAITDPYVGIYRASGVRDNAAAAAAGIATAIHCTNTSDADEKIKIQLRTFSGAIVTTKEFIVPSYYTYTMSTHAPNMFSTDAELSPGVNINQGFFKLWSTTTNMFCTAMIVDAAALVPQGIELHLARTNAPAGVQE